MATKYSDTQKISRRLHFILLMLCILLLFFFDRSKMPHATPSHFRNELQLQRYFQMSNEMFEMVSVVLEKIQREGGTRQFRQISRAKTPWVENKTKTMQKSICRSVCVCVVEQQHCFTIHMALLSVRRGRCTASRNTDSCICIHNTQIQNVQKFCYLLQNNNGASI